jgi:Zn-dependent protease with chaperone function
MIDEEEGDELAEEADLDDRQRSGDREGYSFLSSHPGTVERMARARATANAAAK